MGSIIRATKVPGGSRSSNSSRMQPVGSWIGTHMASTLAAARPAFATVHRRPELGDVSKRLDLTRVHKARTLVSLVMSATRNSSIIWPTVGCPGAERLPVRQPNVKSAPNFGARMRVNMPPWPIARHTMGPAVVAASVAIRAAAVMSSPQLCAILTTPSGPASLRISAASARNSSRLSSLSKLWSETTSRAGALIPRGMPPSAFHIGMDLRSTSTNAAPWCPAS
mmetsp:Transcript_44835/g.135965  ORF Transcript_44835/g.135965 Transcript_44835/m.135965 type:complete len:224 (-) Transcript_44835:258-929(-)